MLIAPRAFPIALNDLSTGEVSPTNSGYSFNWDHAHEYNGASSVAVDHYWILTAGHVAVSSATISVNGEVYTQQEFVKHARAEDPDDNPTADLALVRFDKPFPGYYPLHDAIPLNTEIMIVGHGYPGDVVRNKFSGYFTEDRSGARVRRWGTNKIDGSLIVNDSQGFDFSISGTSGNGGTAREAGCNDKDSGSGVFFNDGGTWKLVGTLANRLGAGPNYTGNFAVGTTHYVNWIKSVIVDYDSDMNGLPDWWEAEHGVSDPAADPDSDTFSNYQEWLADTLPTNGVSYLALGPFFNGADLEFSSSTNRVYQVERNDNLTNDVWTAATDWFVGGHPSFSTNLLAAESNRFYRVRAKLR